jgi:putative chitinase
MTVVTAGQLLKIMPLAVRTIPAFVDPLNAALMKFGITSEQRVEMFIAQFAHETGQLRSLVENLNYSAQGLANTWANRYSSTGKFGGAPNALAMRLNRNPQAIANNVYAGRLGNGDEASGDGWKYRGRGGFQITGRANYEACAKALGLDLIAHPELLEQPEHACESAAWFWDAHKLNQLADSGNLTGTTKVINGGSIGAAERLGLWQIAKEVIV